MARRLKERQIAPLNEEQLTAVLATEGPVRVAACAGSGKTTMLVERCGFLIEEKKVDPDRVLLVTFSSDAKMEMERRLKKRLPSIDMSKSVRTAHSIGLQVYKAEHNTGWTIDPTGKLYKGIIQHVLAEDGITIQRDAIGVKSWTAMIWDFAEVVKREVLGHHEIAEAFGAVDPRMEALGAPQVRAYYRRVEQLRKQGVTVDGEFVLPVTYDDMLYDTAIAFREDGVKKRWAARYDYVLQDEGQDESMVQRTVIESLASETGNYCVVGDPAQALYSFRGGSAEGLLRFEERWPSAQTIKLVGNYRSGHEIITVANHVLRRMPAKTVIDLQMVCKRGTPSEVTGATYQNIGDEARAIAEEIFSIGKRAEEPDWREFAVLTRTNESLAVLSEMFKEVELPHRVSGESYPKGARNTVTLCTIHAAKGRQWTNVYLAQAYDTNHDSTEERRVFYVAVTRARDRLTISYSHEGIRFDDQRPLKFLAEAGIDMYSNVV
jgi:DNA helicase-2/ATP-dependent DNA helicase PcrA